MKRKYDLPEENQGTDKVEEPMSEYRPRELSFPERKAQFIRTIDGMTPKEFERLEVLYCMDRYSAADKMSPKTTEQIREQALRAVKDVKAGRLVDHEELKKRFT